MQILQVLVLRMAKYTRDKKHISLLVLTREYGIIWVHIPLQQARKYGMDIGRILALRYTTKNQSPKYELEHIVGQIAPSSIKSYADISRILMVLALLSRVFPPSLPIESIYDDLMIISGISSTGGGRVNLDRSEYQKMLGCLLWRILGYASHDVIPCIHPDHPSKDRMIKCLQVGQSYPVSKLVRISGVDQALQENLEELAHLYLFSPSSHG